MLNAAIERLLPISKFYDFHPDANINYQLNRHLIAGEQALFAAIGARIITFEDWKSEFFAAAAERERQGDIATAAGLYCAAEFFIAASDPDRTVAYEKFIDLFYRANADVASKRVKIPYRAEHLHGLVFESDKPSRGALVIHCGFDAYIEEYTTLARVFCLAGLNVVMFDGPGQGSTLMRGKVPMTYAWEQPVAAVLDHLSLDDVTLIGISLGGYLALRAAAFEPRVKRVVAFDVMLDFFQCVTSRRGRVAEALLTVLVAGRLHALLNLMTGLMMRRDLYSKWGIEQGMHVMGCATPAQFFAAMRRYNTRDIAHLLTQDVFVMAGAEDHFVPLWQFHEQLRLLTNARSVTGRIFTRAEQARAGSISACQKG